MRNGNPRTTDDEDVAFIQHDIFKLYNVPPSVIKCIKYQHFKQQVPITSSKAVPRPESQSSKAIYQTNYKYNLNASFNKRPRARAGVGKRTRRMLM